MIRLASRINSTLMSSTALLHFSCLRCNLSNIKVTISTSTWLQLNQAKNFSISSKCVMPNLKLFKLCYPCNFSSLDKFPKYLSSQDYGWENLLSSEKKNNIENIPVKRENIYTIPNFLSLMRIGITPYLGYLVIHKQFSLALFISILAGISDVADGYIARKWASQQSALGSALDPLADKVFVSILALSLSYANIMPVFLTSLFVARDLLLIAAVFYLRYRTCPRPVTLKRYFDPTLVNAKLAPTSISKANTVLQIAVIWMSLASPVFGYADHVVLKAFWYLSTFTTIASGFSYVLRKDTVRILKDE